MSEKLIDYIAEKTSLYASDLPLPENSAVILRVISQIPTELFTPGDWSASLRYLMGKHLRFGTPEAAKDYYVKYLIENLPEAKPNL